MTYGETCTLCKTHTCQKSAGSLIMRILYLHSFSFSFHTPRLCFWEVHTDVKEMSPQAHTAWQHESRQLYLAAVRRMRYEIQRWSNLTRLQNPLGSFKRFKCQLLHQNFHLIGLGFSQLFGVSERSSQWTKMQWNWTAQTQPKVAPKDHKVGDNLEKEKQRPKDTLGKKLG